MFGPISPAGWSRGEQLGPLENEPAEKNLTNAGRMYRLVIGSGSGRKVPASLLLREARTFFAHLFTQKRWRDCEGKKPRRTKHLLLASGYVTMLALVVIGLRWFQTDEIHPVWHPTRLLGYYATAVLLYFWADFLIGRFRKREPIHKSSEASDWIFLSLMFLVALTGILVHVFRLAGLPLPTADGSPFACPRRPSLRPPHRTTGQRNANPPESEVPAMAVRTPDHYLNRVKAMTPRVYMNGKRVENIAAHPVTKTVVEANRTSYEWALDGGEGTRLFTRPSHLSGLPCNLYTTLNRGTADLLQRAAAGLYAAERLRTCIYRCVGCDAFNALAATTFEMDRDLGTPYHARLMEFLRHVQEEDHTVAGAMTEPRGRRDQKPEQWTDPDLSLRVVGRNDKGIVVQGAKINISGAYASDWTIVLPSGARRPGEEAYAASFAVPNGEDGMTYICQYTPYSAEREMAKSEWKLGNPRFGQRETSMVVFDNVFVPWEHVFLCGETKCAGRIVTRSRRSTGWFAAAPARWGSERS